MEVEKMRLEEEHLISSFGFKFPKSYITGEPEEAAELAAQIGFPVVMKIASPKIIHKSDVGGVETNLRSSAQVKDAFARMRDRITQIIPETDAITVQIQETCDKGCELFLGLFKDAHFGPILMFGLGGVFTEILHDIQVGVLPITAKDAERMIRNIKGYDILKGYRGQEAVSMDALRDLLLQAGEIGMALADRLDSIDLNPVRMWKDQHAVLDAKVLFTENAEKLEDSASVNVSHLDRFFKASSIAVVGASATPGKIGYALTESLIGHEYQGKVYPVNPRRDEILGLKAYPSLREIDGDIQLVVAATSLASVPGLIEECGELGVHNLVIISAGGKELGKEGQALESRIAQLARTHDVRVIGPNCIGVFDGETRLDTFFFPYDRAERPAKGPVALITQSGTVGAGLIGEAPDLGISKFVSYGNRVDVDEADLITYLRDDPSTKVILCYIEGLREGRKFLRAAKDASAKKPIIVFKAGRTHQAAEASVSHTGFFGGSYSVYEGALRQAGVIAADSLEEMRAIAKALVMCPEASGNRIGMISNGAGAVIQGLDMLEAYRLRLLPLGRNSVKALQERFPPFYIAQNPIDVTASADSKDYEVGIKTLLEDPSVDIVMVWFMWQDVPLDEGIVSVLGNLSCTYEKPIVCGTMGGEHTTKIAERIEAVGVPVYRSVQSWIYAARGLSARHAFLSYE